MNRYAIFRACFPEMDVAEPVFDRLLDAENGAVLEHRDGNEPTGYAVLHGPCLRMLCVLPDHQGHGIGTELLRQAEENVRRAGHDALVVGGTSSRLFPGAPESSRGFFEHRGYDASDPSEEMKGDLSAFRAADFALPVPEGVEFGWYRGNMEALHAAVRDVDPDWVKYFNPGDPIFCATVNGKVASFCSASVWDSCLLSNGKNKVGAPGCVGTAHAFRRQGIGLKMVALACEELSKQGCDTCYIHYTHVAPWYAKLGFRTFLTWYFCQKRL